MISGLIAALMFASAGAKFAGPAPVLEGFEKYGLKDWRIIIGIGEVVSVLLFLIPRTAVLGTLLLSSYLGGAIVTHMQNAEPFIFPAVLLVVMWIAAGLRMPWLFTRLIRRGEPAAL